MDAERLRQYRCYFAGGTAIVLQNGEYRQSLDVDFLCADAHGYRELRSRAVRDGIAGFFGTKAIALRDFRADQYGLRTAFEWAGQTIKFEIVREARIALDGAMDHQLGLAVLSRSDQCAEKLLANADRCLDRSVAYRDAIDLGYLALADGGRFSEAAIAKAEAAYGDDIRRKALIAFERLADEGERRHAATTLDMRPEDAARGAEAFQAAVTLAGW